MVGSSESVGGLAHLSAHHMQEKARAGCAKARYFAARRKAYALRAERALQIWGEGGWGWGLRRGALESIGPGYPGVLRVHRWTR